MKKAIVLVAAMVVGMAGMVIAQEGDIHGTVDLTYQTKYIWRGFDVYEDHSAIQPTVDLDLFGTGFGISAQGHRANSDGYELAERWDYTLYYGGKLFETEAYETHYRLGYVYYNYPDISSHTKSSWDLQEAQAVLSWPNILTVKGLVPSYVLVKLWPSNGDSPVSEASGFAHIFMLDYALPIQCPITNTERTLNLHSEVIYNDGVDPRPFSSGVDHDWSNAVFGITTDFDLGCNLTFTPGVYHQVTMDKSVNDDKDETWARASLTYKF